MHPNYMAYFNQLLKPKIEASFKEYIDFEIDGDPEYDQLFYLCFYGCPDYDCLELKAKMQTMINRLDLKEDEPRLLPSVISLTNTLKYHGDKHLRHPDNFHISVNSKEALKYYIREASYKRNAILRKFIYSLHFMDAASYLLAAGRPTWLKVIYTY